MRVDAKAEGLLICIGGLMPVASSDGRISVKDSPWFSVVLDEITAPWAYSKGEPYRTISALELLATLVALLVFHKFLAQTSDKSYAKVGLSVVEGFTDSRVATHVAGHMSSTKFPLCVVAMELSAQLEDLKPSLSLEWAPREVNQEADDLTNEKFEAFSDRLRVPVVLKDLPWIYLPTALEQGMEFYGQKTKAQARSTTDRKGKRRPLRETDPW